MSGSGVLSEEQVAALVAAAKEGTLPDAPAQAAGSRRRRVRKIDFTRPSKFTTDQQRRLERAHENFCRSLSTRMSAELRTPITLELIDMAQLTWANALEEVPKRSVSGIVDVAPIGGRMLVTAELTLLLSLLERVLGGHAIERPQERALTDVDRVLVARLLQTLLDELSISFGDLAELQFRLVEIETERAPAQLAPLSEPTLALTFEFKLGRSSATIVLLIPHRAIEPVLRTAGASQHDVELAADAAAMVVEAMGEVVVEVRAEVGAVELSLAEVLALQPGDVLRLDGAAGEGAVTLYTDAVALHRAKLGRNGRRRAVGILGAAEVEG